jgi:hypothetical protein
MGEVAEWPDGIEKVHEEPVRGLFRHASPVAVLVLAAVVAGAAIGLFGAEETQSAEAAGVQLEVDSPVRIRSGEFFEMRLHVVSAEPIDELVIGVDASLWQDMTVNTFIPAAEEESSDQGEFRFTFAELAADEPFEVKVDLQVNPDIAGGTDGAVRVYDGERLLVELPMEIGVLP